jgi:GntR family transcriptional regulator, transcriptional repressor for pyruvate dehydrogenase complex
MSLSSDLGGGRCDTGPSTSSPLEIPSVNSPREDSFGTVARVRKAYEQVYDQLHSMIVSGELAQGHRLPTEDRLAVEFGVSRSTIREALRLLLAQNLIRTVKGSGGGSFVTLPTVDHVSEFLERNFELLSLTDDVTLPEFLEARELLEVFAVRHAARRRTTDDLDALRATLLPVGSTLSPYEQYLHNKEFHSILVAACGNVLLRISAQPIFFVLHTHLSRSELSPEFPRQVGAEHAEILEAIESGDADLAESKMRQHLQDLGAVYRGIWRTGGAPARPAARAD